MKGASHGWRLDCPFHPAGPERDTFPSIGAKPVSAIKPPELLQVLKRVEARGAIETTHRVQQNCSQVFRYAVALGLLDSDPSRDLRGAL